MFMPPTVDATSLRKPFYHYWFSMRQTIAMLVAIHFTSLTAIAQSPADIAFFESKIRPLLIERCHECHSTNTKKQRGGLMLDSAAAIRTGGDNGPAAKTLLDAVHGRNNRKQMPPKTKLSANEVALLEEWVRRGLPFPGETKSVIAKGGIDWDKSRAFWSFQPLRPIAPPKVRDDAWPIRGIDRFVLADLEKRGLTPNAAAERRVLIRRVTFDLIGLPPTPEEIDAFVQDDRPDAYAQLVDRLLASPHHGEKWARFWLDLARYCDIAESWAEGKGQAWLYRDWVVQALNDDMPYDRFVRMQLAADLMPDAEPRHRAALGFIGLSPTYWKELQLDKDVIKGVVAEEWEERIHTFGSTFLGLALGCARCHDHKFDPVSVEDYYALAGVFASVKQTDVALLEEKSAQRVREAIAQVQTLEAKIKKLRADKAKQADNAKVIAGAEAEIAAIKQTTPGYGGTLARGVTEASLHVLADGPNRTKLDYRPGVPQNVPVQIRGNPSSEGPTVPRRFLTLFSKASPKPFTQGSGRRELADAIVYDAGPLAARVIVNRIWKEHLGTGLVSTPSDFGSQGARPTHPELLDDLAERFVRNGWSLRWLHREIVSSATYRQSGRFDAKKHAIDPDNRWHWRANRRRLDVEAWRDAMLAVNGSLDRTRGGPALDLGDAKNSRRTIYGVVKRRELHDLLRLFDFPDPTTHSAGRVPTTTALQQLYTLNSPLMRQQAQALVKRLKTDIPMGDDDRIRRAYGMLFGRTPTENQLRLAREFLGSPASDEMWHQYAHVLLGSNEFLFVD